MLSQIRQLISFCDPDRHMTATIEGDVLVLNFITREYRPTDTDPTISREHEPDTGEYRIVINPSIDIADQIEDALCEIEKTPISYE